MSLVGLCWFIPDDDLDTTFPTFHLQVTCWKESLEPNLRAEPPSPPQPACGAPSPVPWMVRKASEDVSGWSITVSRQVACHIHWRMMYQWSWLGGAASSRKDGWGGMPGSWDSSEFFSSRADEAGSEKASWKGSAVLPSRWEVRASRSGNGESKPSSRVCPSCPRWEVPAGIWCGRLAAGACGTRVIQCFGELQPGHWQQSEKFRPLSLALCKCSQSSGVCACELSASVLQGALVVRGSL